MASTLQPSSHCSRWAACTSWPRVSTVMLGRSSAAAIAACISSGGWSVTSSSRALAPGSTVYDGSMPMPTYLLNTP